MTRALLIAPLLIACNVTETGNPPFAGQMALLATSSDDARVSIGGGGSEVTIEEAWIVIDDIRLQSQILCDSGTEIRVVVTAPGAVDLALSPTIVPFMLPSDDYCRARFPLARAVAPLPAGAPPTLVDHSVVVIGTRVSDGAAFEARLRETPELDVRSRGAPFRLDAALRALVVAFDAARWFEGVSLAGATTEPGGNIVIEQGTNDAIADALEANVERSFRMFRDLDEEGDLDPEDESELVAEGGT
jgi:hypothetical protein